MSIQFNVEQLEPRKLLSCLPEPEFVPEPDDDFDGYWMVYTEGMGSSAGGGMGSSAGYRLSPDQFVWWEATSDRRGLLTQAPSDQDLDLLLAEDVGWFPGARAPQPDPDEEWAGSYYAFSMITIAPSDDDYQGSPLSVEIVASKWLGYRFSWTNEFQGNRAEETTTVQFEEHMSMQLPGSCSSDCDETGLDHYSMYWQFDSDFSQGEFRDYRASGSLDYELLFNGDDAGSEVLNFQREREDVAYITAAMTNSRSPWFGDYFGELVGDTGYHFWGGDFETTFFVDIPPEFGERLLVDHDFGHSELLVCDGAAEPPILESISARGRSGDDDSDGLIDWAGRYVGGVEHDERIDVTFSAGTPYAVRFELMSDEHEQVRTDTNGSNGWNFSPDLHELSTDAQIKITVNPGAGDQIVHTIELAVIGPGLLSDHEGSWNASDHTYDFVRDHSITDGDAFHVDAASLLAEQLSDEDQAVLEVAKWKFGIDLRSIETFEVSMDPAITPVLANHALVTRGAGFGRGTFFEEDYEPEITDGEAKLTFSVSPPQPEILGGGTLGFTFAGKLTWEFDDTISTPEALYGWIQMDLSVAARIGVKHYSDYHQLAPLGSSGLAVYGRVGVKFDGGGTLTGTQRLTTEPGSASHEFGWKGGVEVRATLGVDAVVSVADPFSVFDFADYVNAGVKVEGTVILKKEWERAPGESERESTVELNGRWRVSLAGKFFDWSGSIVLWTFGPYELVQGFNGPDPIIDSTLVHAGVPTLVSLESPTFESTPYVVTQTWDGSRWSEGVILGDDGRAKFGIDAAALGDGLGLVYSGHAQQRGTYGFEGVNAQSFVSDTELWFSRDGGQILRLTSNDAADLSPRLVFSEDGLTGMLVWVRITGTIDKPVSQIMYRLWEGDGFGEEMALTDPGRVADPQVRRLADGRFAINWRDAEGNLHTRISGEEWIDLAMLEIEGVYDILEIDGVLHAMAAARDPGLGYTGLTLYRYEDDAWTELGELSPFVSNITSLDAGYDGDGHLVVGLTNADGNIHAVYSGLVPLDDLGADVFVRADGREWQPGDVSVLPAGDHRYHLAYGLFPTSLDQTEPPASEIRRAPGARLASGVHLIDGTPIRDSRVGGLSGSGGSLSLIALTDGGVAVYERGADIGGDATVIDLGVYDAFAADTWTDGGDARYVILSPGKVQVWIDGALTDLTGSLGAEPIAEHLTVFTARDGRVFLAGMTEAGELVAYSEKDGVWNFRNISVEDLAPQEIDTPVFAGKIASYVTRWNGLNIAGIDANGDIQGIWWAPGLERWTVSNLSEITGAPLSVGNLAVTLTPWGGINLAATTVDGRLRVTWWVPSFGGSWVVSDLTQNADGVGLQLRPETTFGYTTPWGALNFGGIDQTGELVVFWWVPGRETWTPAELSQPGASLYSDLRSLVSESGETSIVGETEDGGVVRYWWAPGEQSWQFETLDV